MLYHINTSKDVTEEIDFNQIAPNKLIAGIITIEELKANNNIFNFSDYAITECANGAEQFRSSIDVYDEYSFGIINIVDLENLLGQRDRIGFFIKKNLFLLVDVIDNDKSTAKLFQFGIERIKPSNMTLERVIYSVLEGLLYNDNKALEKLEFEVSAFEEEVSASHTPKNFTQRLLILRKKLLLLHNYYEQLIDIGEELRENKNDNFNDENLRYFKLFTAKAARLSQTVSRLRENVIHIREAYQANMDFTINNTMKIFTVVTTVFMPLTLIVGWYGMNFTTMPELSWEYGYLGVIALSIFVIIFCIWFFKKKKLF